MNGARTHGLVVFLTAGLVVSACTSAATPTPAATSPATQAPTAAATSAAPAKPTPVVFPKPEVSSITVANAVPTEILGFAVNLANVKNFYGPMGLTVKVVGEDAGDAAAIQALAAGQAQFAFAGPGILNTVGTDAPAVMLGLAAVRDDDGLFCKGSIKTAADLKGATIAISTFGGSSNASVLLALRALNVAATDVTIKQVGGQGARIAAMKGGSIDCAPVQDTEGQASLPTPQFNMLIDLATVESARFPVQGLMVTKDFMAKNPNTVLDVTAAVLQAMNYMFTNTADTVTAFAADQQIKESEAQPLVAAYVKLAPRSMVTTPADWDIAIQLYQQNKPNAPAINASQVIDTSVLQKLKDMGWYAQIGNPQTP